jgi:hypothetical protein
LPGSSCVTPPAMLSPTRMVSRASVFNFYVCKYCVNGHR